MLNAGRPAALPRRLGAMVYDSLLLAAVLFIAGLPLPLIPATLRLEPWVRHFTFLYMLLVAFLFFGWFWTHGGQTLGMRAWRLRVVTAEHQALSWRLAWRRFAWALLSLAPAGAGFAWSLFDSQRRAWHDCLSGTRLLHLVEPSVTAQQQRADADE